MRTGENIYKRKDGRWEARYRKARNNQGKIIYGFCYGKTYSEAKSKLERARIEVHNAPKPIPIDNPQFKCICDEWLHSNRLRLKPSSYAKYQTSIEKHIVPVLGKLQLSQLSTEMISKFGLELLTVRGLAPKTVQDILVLVHAILKYGSKQYPGMLSNVEVLYPPKVTQEMRVLSPNEQKFLTSYLLEDLSPCKFGVLLALWTGLRIGEVCALRWNRVDLQEQIIKIDATMQRVRIDDPMAPGKTKVLVDSPKTASSVREIPINKQTAALCRRMYPGDDDAYVLTGSQKAMEPRLLQYYFQNYASDCNLEGVTFHTLRHTFATRCVEVDFEIKSLSEILGHANTSITLNRYVHCSLELKRANMKKLESLYLQSQSKE